MKVKDLTKVSVDIHIKQSMTSEERVKVKARLIDMARCALTRKRHDRIFFFRYLFISAAC